MPRRRHWIVLAALAGGCFSETPYQPMGYRGGYEDSDLGGGRHRITVRVNSNTSRGRALEYLHRRAGELCQDGYDLVDRLSGDNGDVLMNDSKPEVNAIVACRGFERREPSVAARLPPPPRYYCAWSPDETDVGVCTTDRAGCAAARATLEGDGHVVGPCRDMFSAVCFQMERDGVTTTGCAPTPRACERQLARLVEAAPTASASACATD